MAKLCPFLREPCLEHGCTLYIQLLGTNPQTGNPVDQWLCSVAAMPMLTIENSQQQRQTGAAVESLRNEVVAIKRADQILDATRQFPHLIEGRS